MADPLALTIVFTLLAGIGAQVLGRIVRVPAIVFLLALGVVLGPHVLGLIRPDAIPASGLSTLVQFFVALIVFEGALTLDARNYLRASGSIRLLVTLGAAISFLGAALLCRLVLGWPWTYACMFGCTMMVTGPTVIHPILQRIRVRRPVYAILKWESILIDPIGAVAAVLLLDLFLHQQGGWVDVTRHLFMRVGAGVLVGGLGGFALNYALRWLYGTVQKDVEILNIAVLGAAIGLFCLSEVVAPESGLIAITIGGLILGHGRHHWIAELREFKSQLVLLLVGFLFVILSAGVNIPAVLHSGWRDLLVVAAVVWGVRAIAVWCSTMGGDLSHGDRFFITWIGPKGIVAAAVASLFADRMAASGQAGPELKGLVFLAITVSVLVAGTTAGWMARRTGVTSSHELGVVIVGANALARIIAKALVEAGVVVKLADTRQAHCREAQKQGLVAYHANVCEGEQLLLFRLDELGQMLTATPSAEVNALASVTGREHFGAANVASLVDDPELVSATQTSARAGTSVTLTGARLSQAIHLAEKGELVCGVVNELLESGDESVVPIARIDKHDLTFLSESPDLDAGGRIIGLYRSG